MVWIDHVESDVALNDLGHQPVYGAPASGDRVQNVRAFGAFLKRSFDRFNLPLDVANPIQELILIANDVCQLDQSPSTPRFFNSTFQCFAATGTTFGRHKSIFA
jgi:hypothetical protein